MKNATACPFLGGGTPGLLSVEGKSSKAHLIADKFILNNEATHSIDAILQQ